MSLGLLIGLVALTAVVVVLLAGIGWMMWPKARSEEPQVVSEPERAPIDEATLDPADRNTLPPTVGLFEEEDLEDAETVMASSEDMARVLADLHED